MRWTEPFGTLYGVLVGKDDDIAQLYDWAQGGEETRDSTPRTVNLWTPDR